MAMARVHSEYHPLYCLISNSCARSEQARQRLPEGDHGRHAPLRARVRGEPPGPVEAVRAAAGQTPQTATYRMIGDTR